MANANVAIITTANTFQTWLNQTNNLANLVNGLLNGLFYSDNGSLTMANGSIVLSAGAGTLLSVSGNATISQQLTSNSILNTGDATIRGNNILLSSNTNIVQVANSLVAKLLISNTTLTAQNINAAGYLSLTGNNLSSALAPTVAYFNQLALVNVANNVFITNTGNVQIKGTLYLSNLTAALNVAGNVDANNINASNNVTGVNGVFQNIQVSGQSVISNSVSSSDTMVLRYGLTSDGDGHITVVRGTGKGNADLKFDATNQAWRVTANVANGYSTLLSIANASDSFLNTSSTNVATSLAVNTAYAAAIANATAVVANSGVFVAQRKGLNIVAGNNITLNVAANGANANLVDITFNASGGTPIDSVTSTSITSPAAANSVAWVKSISVQKSGDSMSGNLNMANNQVVNPILRGYREALIQQTATASITIDMGASNFYDITLAGNPVITLANCGPTGNVSAVTVVLRQSANGSNTFTVANTVRYNDNTTPILTTTANRLDVLYFMTFTGGTIFYASQVLANVPVS